MKEQDVILGEKVIGPASSIFVTAVIAGVAAGNPGRAFHVIDAAAESGADAVRFRTRRGEGASRAPDRLPGPPGGEERVLPWEDQVRLKQHAESRGLVFLSMPLDEESADYMDGLGVPAFSVASGDITHTPLLHHIASKEKPVFLATGMSYLNEVADAVWALRSGGASGIILIHSIASHPTDPESLNLLSIQTLRNHFKLLVGFSDSSVGILYSNVAAALGAVVIEKRLVLGLGEPEAADRSAITPEGLRQLVRDLRAVKLSLGDGRKRPVSPEEPARVRERRSIVAAVDIRAFERLDPWMLACRPPGNGLAPSNIDKLLGMYVRRDIAKGTLLQWDDLSYAASWETDAMETEAAAVAKDGGAVPEGESG